MVLIVFTAITSPLFAQETQKITKSRSNIQNNKTTTENANQEACVVSVKSIDGMCVVDYRNVSSPRDHASGQASGKRMHKPYMITKELGVTEPTENDLIKLGDPASGLTKGKTTAQSISNVTAKVMHEDSWSAPMKLALVNGEYILPIDCKSGKCEVELSWSWGATNSGSKRSYTGGRFALSMDNGVCNDMTLVSKGTLGADNTPK
jgi:hypothetical protein